MVRSEVSMPKPSRYQVLLVLYLVCGANFFRLVQSGDSYNDSHNGPDTSCDVRQLTRRYLYFEALTRKRYNTYANIFVFFLEARVFAS